MGSDDDERHKHNLNVSHKVTLAAVSSLFAVTLLVILFFLYIKYRQNRRRESRRRSDFISRLVTAQITPSDHVDANHITNRPPPKAKPGGLDPHVIDALPEFVYKSSAAAAANRQNRRRGGGASESVVECAVCLSSITDDAKVRLLPNCNHLFHVDCVDLWLGSNTTCPLCRAAVEPRVPHPEEGGSNAAVVVEPTAPPVDELSLLHGDHQDDNDEKASGSGSRPLSSFRRMLSRERSSRRSSLGSCGESAAVVDHQVLERQ
ncbi:43kDa postsynaptic protein [Trema orientale]|uniref:RING-type E3 ubiquitin transferase n=1 Tax=Trema orientale TaxID=63057 RepID=A0A2P5C8N6_TREOI|nr:43kDa postsynaptic protein [Trema orientale]